MFVLTVAVSAVTEAMPTTFHKLPLSGQQTGVSAVFKTTDIG
jgi:hypothetical protein